MNENSSKTIYEALEKDHRAVEALIDEIIASSETGDGRWKSLLDQLRAELIPHAHAEEAVFYNALREADESKSLVFHSYAEHAQADMLVRTLIAAKAIDINFTTAARKLRDDLRHHIETEEGRVFSAARKVFSDEEARQIGAAFERLKPEYARSADSMLVSDIDLIANLMPKRLVDVFTRGMEAIKPGAKKRAA